MIHHSIFRKHVDAVKHWNVQTQEKKNALSLFICKAFYEPCKIVMSCAVFLNRTHSFIRSCSRRKIQDFINAKKMSNFIRWIVCLFENTNTVTFSMLQSNLKCSNIQKAYTGAIISRVVCSNRTKGDIQSQ